MSDSEQQRRLKQANEHLERAVVTKSSEEALDEAAAARDELDAILEDDD